ncbi:hypothetical protein K2173_028358 [Erythroxylum novogranatense]|uniref:Uncharacterized protein n=1 Tax=Erythroxylum novogranatense TaxID=1862640 RepID=A0AAV8U1M7_9ROSI|nr:hypothetical protein K2173_028358 [Erythroxylum novogranatense]
MPKQKANSLYDAVAAHRRNSLKLYNSKESLAVGESYIAIGVIGNYIRSSELYTTRLKPGDVLTQAGSP